MRLQFLLAAALLLSAAGGANTALGQDGPPDVSPAKPGAVENSVVKVFATLRYPDVFKPWAKQQPVEVSGSGVVIEGKRILTNAHVALYASQMQVQGSQSGDKVSATVEAIAPGIDLAVLKLDDESFFDGHPPLARAAAVPDVKDPVLVYGFPTGGSNLSITKGIVSRVEFAGYSYFVSGLRIQIDAAINPGNSGGPAVVGDKMIGLAFSRLGGTAENIGYIIPSEEIDLFLGDVADGRYDGKPAMYDELQTLESPALRSYLRLGKSVHGIIVHELFNDDPGHPLKEWDVITKIGDAPIDDQGMIMIGNLRLGFRYLIQKLARGGKVPLTVVREGKELAVQLPVSPVRPALIPFLQGAYPSYFIYGPIVFSAATGDFVNSLGNFNNLLGALGNPLVTRRADKPAFPGEQLVVVSSQLFPHKLGEGYSPNPTAHVLKSVNGHPVANLRDLVERLRDCRDPFVVFAFWGHNTETLVFPAAKMRAATEDILADNGVRSQGSADMMAVWNAK